MSQRHNAMEDEQLDPPLMWIVVPAAIAVVYNVVVLVAFFLR